MGTKILASCGLAFSLFFSAQVSAATITYDFTGASSGLGVGDLGVSSATVSSGGLDLVVSAVDELGAAASLARNNSHGLGVIGEPGTGSETNQVGADNTGGESLVFDFSPASVTILDAVVFELGKESGSLDVYADNVLLETILWSTTTGSGNTGNSDVLHTFSSPALARTAQSFTFKAVEDSFRVVSLSVETVIPEPTSLLLSLVGLGFLRLTVGRRSR